MHCLGSPGPQEEREKQTDQKSEKHHGQSDEEIRAELHPHPLPYRQGWPRLSPLPLTTVRRGAKDSQPNATSLLNQCKAIATVHQLTNPNISFAFKIPRDAPKDLDDTPTQYLTLLVLCDFVEDAHKVERCIIEMRRVFQQHGETNTSIEAIDYRAEEYLRSFAIRPTEAEALEKWEDLQSEILSILKSHRWLSLELVNRCFTRERSDAKPTMVITTPTARNDVWYDEVIPKILAAVNREGPAFEVELLCGVSLFTEE